MLSRILGVIACMFPMGWGSYSMYQGLNNGDFGPIFGGLIFIMISAAVILLIISDYLEQIVNKMKGDAVEAQLSHDYWTARELKELNTPDPNLIHPDHAKRAQASGHDSYPRVDMKV